PPQTSTLFPYTTLFRSPFANLAGYHQICLRVSLPHDGRGHDSGIQHYPPHERLTVANRAQSAAKVQPVADHGDHVLGGRRRYLRSEEHTSELQSLAYLV